VFRSVSRLVASHRASRGGPFTFGDTPAVTIKNPIYTTRRDSPTLYFGLVFAPAPTRAVLSTFTAIAGSDALQHVYVGLQQATE
jgi:hypothetical protein